MPRAVSIVGPVESIGGTPMLRLPRTPETAALEVCVPARVAEEHILVALPDKTLFPAGSTVEVYEERGVLVIRRYAPRDEFRSARTTPGNSPAIAWHAIPAPLRWHFTQGSYGFEVTVMPQVTMENR